MADRYACSRNAEKVRPSRSHCRSPIHRLHRKNLRNLWIHIERVMNERILVIDDEEHIRRMMSLTLEAAGYQVGEAKDAAEGLRLYADGSRWDAVVLDQRMPGMDGLVTLRQIKTQNNDARVVMATAYASIELAVDAMKLGATDFVRKPMTPKVL